VEIICYDFDANGTHDLIGKFTSTVRDWLFGDYQRALVNPEKLGGGYESSGTPYHTFKLN